MVRISRVLIAVAATGVLVSGCTVKKTERPPLTGPSELALSINLTANPDVVTQDGTSQSRIVILARDQNGVAVKGLPMRAELFVNKSIPLAGTLSAADITTGNDGRATLTYTAPPLPPDSTDQGILITVSVVPTGTDYANAVPRSVNIRLVPPGVVTQGPVASFSFSPFIIVPNTTVNFDASASTASEGATLVSYTWDFGDNTTGSGMRPQHVYRATGNYDVGLIVMDSTGRTSYATWQTVTVTNAQAPTADFVFSPTAPLPKQTVFLNASTSRAGAGRTLASYRWDLGNGTTASGLTATTTYQAAGTYTVVLTVTDDIGQTATKGTQINVSAGGLRADFTTSVALNTVVVDPGLSSPSLGATIATYTWVFGDSTQIVTDTYRVQLHTYPNPGYDVAGDGSKIPRTATYAITLTITDSSGLSASTSKTVTIYGY